MIRRLAFWSAAALLAYGYVGFPALVAIRGFLVRRPVRAAAISPTVSVIMAARNESAVIAARLANLAAQDYPPDRVEVIVASDGSDDGTNDIVRERHGSNIRLLALSNQGKIPALNAAAAAATGEILVFTDANTVFALDALTAIVRPFADPEVGGVAGDQRYIDTDGTGGVGGERTYWDFDRWLKRLQSRAGSVTSATGALYAIRRELFEPIPAGVTDDFAISTGPISAGRRLVFAPDALAYEPPAATGRLEFRRKVRIISQGLRGVLLRRDLLDPGRHGFYAIQLFSHKVLRRLMVFPVLVITAVSPLLWSAGRLYRLTAIGSLTLVGLAAIGLALPDRTIGRGKMFSLPAFFWLVNGAALAACWDIVRGRRIERWEPVRGVGGEAPTRLAR